MRAYTRLTTRERYLIWTWRYETKPALSFAVIAKRLNRAKSTIFNEVHKNRMRPDVSLNKLPYNPEFADFNAEKKRRQKKLGTYKVNAKQLRKIKKLQVERHMSIPMIAHHNGIELAPATLYKYLRRGFAALSEYKLRKHRKKAKRFKPTAVQQAAVTARSIELRPARATKRQHFGHWEMDCIDSRSGVKAALLVLVERLTRFTVVYKVSDKSSSQIVGALRKFKQRYKSAIKTITTDRGSEFTNTNVMFFLESNNIGVYYTHPYSPEEKGTIERINRDIRQYFPRKTSFANVTPTEVRHAVNLINGYPRQTLQWDTPNYRFNQAISRIGKKSVVNYVSKQVNLHA